MDENMSDVKTSMKEKYSGILFFFPDFFLDMLDILPVCYRAFCAGISWPTHSFASLNHVANFLFKNSITRPVVS